MWAPGCAEDVGAPGSPPRVLSHVPSQGATAVSRSPRLVLRFDRPLGPRGVPFEAVVLRSGPRSFPLRLVSDPIASSLEVVPDAILDPDTTFRLTVVGVLDLDGSPSAPITVSFSTATSTAPDPIPSAQWDDVAPTFERCAECHVGDGAPLGLDLSSPERILATAIGVPAREVATEDPVSSRRGLLGLARIEPGWPADSFLVWKLTGDPHVPGAPMPMDGTLEAGEAERVVAWVRAGAPLP